jgi:GT2 family glycosyltransferase
LESLHSSSVAPHEIIVVDDASTDGTAQIAAQSKCRVLRMDENIGAARAKNRGAAEATGDILFFTDDDVVVECETLERITEDFSDPRVAGVVGLFNARIPFEDFASNFKNLWMRFTYERLPSERIGVFYTSIAAMRRETFRELGGFDENYRGASIAEDTEFGQRAWGARYVLRLDPRVTAAHHKHYTTVQVLVTDYLRARALMLMRLRKRGDKFFTSVPLFYQIAVPVIFSALVVLLVALMTGSPLWAVVAIGFFAAFYVLFVPWLAYLARERGVRFALFGVLFQPIDAVVVGLGMLAAVVEFAKGGRY